MDTSVKTLVVALVAVASFVAGGVVAVAAGAFAPETIVSVRGSGQYGFTVDRLGARTLFVPTKSEMMAECSEYDKRIERRVCRVRVNADVRRYTDVRRAIRYQRSR